MRYPRTPPPRSWLDKAIAYVSPAAAVRRARARAALDIMAGTTWYGQSSYDAVLDTRHRTQMARATSHSTDEDSALGAYDRETLILEIRAMFRNYGLAFAACQRFANGVVGHGLRPVPQTTDRTWNETASAFWGEYEKVCDARQRVHSWELQRLTVMARMYAGELFFIKRPNGQVEPVEAERVRSPSTARGNDPTLVDGVRLSTSGIPTGFYVCPRDSSGYPDQRRAELISWRDGIHAAVVGRPDQLRGIPELAPVCNYLRDKRELNEATLFKAKGDAFRGWGVYSDEDVQALNMGDRTATQTATTSGIRVEKMDAGQVWYLGRADRMESLDSKTPNPQYEAFNSGLVREISAALSMPAEVLLLGLADTSFSGGRGILMMAYRTFDIWRRWLIYELMQPWWNWRVAMAIKRGDLPEAPVDERGISQWYRVAWVPPPEEYVDPTAEANSNKTNVELGTDTVSAIARRKSTTAAALFAEKVGDIEDAQRLAEEWNERHPSAPPLTWRDISNAAVPGSTPAQAMGPGPARPLGDAA